MSDRLCKQRFFVCLILGIGMLTLLGPPNLGVCQQILQTSSTISEDKVLEMAEQFIQSGQGDMSFLGGAQAGRPTLVSGEWRVPILKDGKSLGFFHARATSLGNGTVPVWFAGPGDNQLRKTVGPPNEQSSADRPERPVLKGTTGNQGGQAGTPSPRTPLKAAEKAELPSEEMKGKRARGQMGAPNIAPLDASVAERLWRAGLRKREPSTEKRTRHYTQEETRAYKRPDSPVERICEAELLRHFTCHDPSNADYTKTDLFYNCDYIAWKYTEWNTSMCQENGQACFVFYTPEGRYYTDLCVDLRPGADLLRIGVGIEVCGTPAEDILGVWSVEVYQGDVVEAKNYFEITYCCPPTLLQEYMCRDPYEPKETATTTFCVSDLWAAKWTLWNSQQCDQIIWVSYDFYDPEQQYYLSIYEYILPGYREWYTWGAIYICGDYPATFPGPWSVDVYAPTCYYHDTNSFTIVNQTCSATLEEEFMCRDPYEDPYGTRTNTFYTTDSMAAKYTVWNTQQCERCWTTACIDFYDPYGNWYWGECIGIPPGQEQYWFWAAICISDCYPAYNPGNWTADVWLCEELMERNRFDIIRGRQEACCFPGGGCDDMDPTDCILQGGIPQGQGTMCAEVKCPIEPAVETDQFDYSIGELELVMPNQTTETVPVSGTATAEVYFEGTQEGDADDDDGDFHDEVLTRMIDLNLTGLSSILGPVQVTLHPSIPSLGEIEETADVTTGLLDVPPFGPDGTTASSFFDLYFQIDVAGQTFYTIQPKRMRSLITHKPPGPADVYENLEDIPLVDENGNPTGYYLGATRHRPQPPIEIDQFDYSIGTLELMITGGPTEMVAVSGSATAAVYFEGQKEGDAHDHNGNDLDEVATEIVALSLTGLSPTLGPVHVGLNPEIPSLGEIEETADVTTGLLDVPPFGPNGTTASSYFDLFFQIDVGGETFYTVQPKRMRSVITHKPPGPGDVYESLEEIPLVDENGKPTGIYLAATRHRPRPPVEIDVFDFSLGELELQMPDQTTELIPVGGPTTAAVFFEGQQEGDANDDDGDGEEEVQTELVEMSLTGSSPTLGPVHVGLNPNIPSLGEIEETMNSTRSILDLPPFAPQGTADSFFDVFFEIEVGGQTFYTIRPKRMRSVITYKPPGLGDVYENVERIELVDANGRPTGIYIVAARHQPNPLQACCFRDGSCADMIPTDCVLEGGIPQGQGTVCAEIKCPEQPAIETDQFDYSIGQLELVMPDGTTELVAVSGPATAAVYFEGTQEGDADDDDGDTRDEVVTEMVALSLTGLSPILGPVQIVLNPTIPSLGEIEETADVTTGLLDVPPFGPEGTTAHSFFDLYFQIDVAGQTFYTVVPKRMSSVITHKPPGPIDVYENLEDIPLVDEFGRPTGYYLGATRHRPQPPVEIDQFDYSIGQLELLMPDGTTEQVSVSGPATAAVFFEGQNEGDANDDNGNGRDEVATEMVDLNLTGLSPTLGPIHVSLNPALPSLGEIEETADVTTGLLDVPPFGPGGTTADSYFDLYFQIDVGGQTFYTVVPKRMRSRITHKPPGPVDVYENLEDIPLVDEFGRPTGYYLSATRHRPRPPVEIDVFDFSLGTLELLTPLGVVLVPVSGPATAHVYFEGENEGDANDDDGNGQEEVQTELVELNLSGVSPDLGQVHVRLHPDLPSLGEIEETANNTPGTLDLPPFAPEGSADSFFDIFFEIEVGDQLFYTIVPKRMSSRITHKPPGPGDLYENLVDIPLVDEFGRPTGYYLGATRHRPNPPVEIDVFDYSIGEMELLMPNGSSEIISVSGSATAHVFFEGSAEGDANDDNNNSLDEVLTEMVALDLSGNSPTLGPVHVGLNPNIQSLGEIEETADVTTGLLDVPPFGPTGTSASSFFDLYFQVKLPDLDVVLYTIVPKRMKSIITHKPPGPGDVYENLVEIPLVDEFGRPTGYYLGVTRHIPTPGEGEIEKDLFETTSALVQLVGGPVGPVPVPFILSGPAEAWVFFEGPLPGDADDDDHDGLDEVETELVSLNLTDGIVTLMLNPNYPSPGEIEELVNNNPDRLDVDPFHPGDATSFFDVYFQIDMPGLTVHNEEPLHIESVISHKPPIARYFHIIPATHPIELFDEAGNATGVYIVKAEHYTGYIEVDQFDFSLGELELVMPDGNSELISVSGPITVHVFFEPDEGDADDDDNDGKEEVVTELVELSLSGFSPTLGPVHVRLHPTLSSLGEIEERTNNTPDILDLPPFTSGGMADSFFDIFFEIEVGGQYFYTIQPKRMSSRITEKPPGPDDVYENLEDIPLVDEFGRPTGYFLGATRHRPNPLQACCFRDGSCMNLNPGDCIDRNGFPQGPGTICLGDSDQNGIDDICEADSSCEDCGPGPHWVDQCPGGMDHMPSGALVGIDMDLDCLPDISLVLSGPVFVSRSNPRDDSQMYPGVAPIDGHLEVIDTEIISMSLSGGGGVTLTAGGGYGQGGVLARSLGTIVEKQSDPKLADSFFDVFFEVNLGGGVYVYNHTPMRVSSVIDCVPPNARYVHPIGCLALYNSPTPGQGREVARLVTADHDTYPEPEACCFRDGSCMDAIPAECVAQGGLPQGPETYCLGDENQNGVDDACEENVVYALADCDEFCQGEMVNVPIVIDMTWMKSPDEKLGSFTGTLDWNSSLLTYVSHSGPLAGFSGLVNVSPGYITFNGANPTGVGGKVTVLIVTFDVIGEDSSTGVIDLDFSAMAAAETFTDLLPYLRITDCGYHIERCGLCGDLNDDGLCNSTDANIILTYDVGLPIPVDFLDRINAGCGDINDDGLTNSTDANIILTYDAGIPVPFPICDVGCPCPGIGTRKTMSIPGGKASAIPSESTPKRGDFISVPVIVDVTGIGERLGSFTATLDWNPEVLRFVEYSGGATPNFGHPVVNTEGTSSGQLVFANANAEGAKDVVNLINVDFEAIGPEGSFTPLNVRFSALSTAHTFSDLLSGLDVTVSRGVSIGQIPSVFSLDQNYPNPFNLETTIRYQLPEAGHVTLAIYNVLGQKIRTLEDGYLEAGRYSTMWDGRDASGSETTSGIYIYRLEVRDLVMARRMLLLK